MATDGTLGNGVRVGFSFGASPFTWVEIPYIMNVDIPGLESEQVDSTVHGTGGFRSNISGLKAVADMTMTLRADLDPATTPEHDQLLQLSLTKEKVEWRVELPISEDLSTTQYRPIEFRGDVGSWKPGTPIDGIKSTEVVVRFSASGTYAADPYRVGFPQASAF